MLSTTVRRLASANLVKAAATSLRDPTLKYDFIPAEPRDKGEIMDVTLNHLFTIEPHSRALGINSENGKPLIDWIVSKSLKYPYSFRIVDKATRKMVGIRLMTEWERSTKDHTDDFDVASLDEGTLILVNILENLKTDFWKLRPEANKAAGIDGIMSEASSIANQTLLLKNGYEELKRSNQKEYVRSSGEPVVFPDETRAIKLVYRNLKNISSL